MKNFTIFAALAFTLLFGNVMTAEARHSRGSRSCQSCAAATSSCSTCSPNTATSTQATTTTDQQSPQIATIPTTTTAAGATTWSTSAAPIAYSSTGYIGTSSSWTNNSVYTGTRFRNRFFFRRR